MTKINSLMAMLITFMFIASYAETITDSLPKEFFENVDLYSKLDMIENLSVLEKISDRDLQIVTQKTEPGTSEVSP